MPVTLEGLGMEIHSAINIPPRAERLAPVPDRVLHGPAGPAVRNKREDGQLWRHQSMALNLLQQGNHAVVSTSTASGKSLIFQAHALTLMGQNRDTTTLVLNPLRALAEDQLGSWRELGEQCGLNPDAIVKIDGSIPMQERERMLDGASIAIMTPDICQAWVMRNSGRRVIQDFMTNLKLLVIDEAHVYDSVFGSNASYLFRRLLNMRDLCADPREEQCQIVAATATISNAAAHLQELTGRPFEEISEAENGAEMHERTVVHIEGQREDDMATVIENVMGKGDGPKFIAFMDSRQGVERVARRIRFGKVLAYRNGYEAKDRTEIERALRAGDLNGVISTSALELGINIPGLTMGMNLRLPSTRKGFRQRVGRVGRDGPGTFAIVGPANLFAQYGETLEQYYESSAEPSVLYLKNKFIQFANAQCMTKESGARPEDIDESIWPAGFREAVRYASNRRHPPEYDAIERAGRRNPHLAHAIRNLPEGEITLVEASSGRRIGTTTLSQAMRESYPGASYLHAGRRYKTERWETNGEYGQTEIPVAEYANPERTEPLDKREVTVTGVVDGNLMLHADGCSYVAEVYTSIRSQVVGYTSNGRAMHYEETETPQREFDTTGVLLRIGADWGQWAVPRAQTGMWLESILRYDQSIANWDVDHSDDPVLIKSVRNPDGELATNAILVYDETHGSLRLTEALYRNFDRYIAQLERSMDLEGERMDPGLIKQLVEWAAGLERPAQQTEARQA